MSSPTHAARSHGFFRWERLLSLSFFNELFDLCGILAYQRVLQDPQACEDPIPWHMRDMPLPEINRSASHQVPALGDV